MRVEDIVRRVRETAGDLTVLQFTNITLTDWINDGIRECVVENSLLQARATSNTAPGQPNYTLPADLFKIHSVWIDNKKVPMMTLEEWEALFTGDQDPSIPYITPVTCYVYAGALTVYPTPDAVVPIVINYTQMPASINFDGAATWSPITPPIPEAYHNRIVSYCLAQVALQDDDYAKHEALMLAFKTGVFDLKHATTQEDDLYPFISVSTRDMGDNYGSYGEGLY